jgi:hypothetical protein
MQLHVKHTKNSGLALENHKITENPLGTLETPRNQSDKKIK